MMLVLRTALACLLLSNIAADDVCVPFTAEYGIVCVCNATYCDTAGSLPDLADGEYVLITTSESGQRFNVTNGTTTLSQIPHNMLDGLMESITAGFRGFSTFTYITVDPRITYQEMEGFGGTFTDTTGLNILNISSETQEYLLKSYFGADGLDYTLGCVPIGGTDFSLYAYAYNEYPVNDTNLSNFTLSEEDYTLKIPLIKRAQELASDDIRIYAATWSPPAWMKTNNALYGYSQLKTDYYHTYALYHLKFLEEYNKENVTIYSLSTGNEPIISSLGDVVSTNSLGWVPEEQAKWIINHFGPVIRESQFSDTNVAPSDVGIKLGSWSRAEEYLDYMIQKIQHHVSGWIDWNLAVNMEGGPAWNNNTIDAFIVVDAENDQFFKTPMYYAFGHVSKHVPRGSERIATNTINGVPNVAFKRPDGLISLVSLNNGTADKIVTIDDRSTGQLIKYTMEAHSMTTIVYKPKSFI